MKEQLHDSLEQCPFCKRYMLAQRIKDHECEDSLSEVKEIPVAYFYETQTESGSRVIIAHAFNGILYRLIESKNPLADDSYHDPSNRRRVNRTKKKNSFFHKNARPLDNLRTTMHAPLTAKTRRGRVTHHFSTQNDRYLARAKKKTRPPLFRTNPNALPLGGKRRVNKSVSQTCTLRIGHVA